MYLVIQATVSDEGQPDLCISADKPKVIGAGGRIEGHEYRAYLLAAYIDEVPLGPVWGAEGDLVVFFDAQIDEGLADAVAYICHFAKCI